MTITPDTGPTATYAAAAALARDITKDDNPADAAYRFGRCFADLFDALGDEHLRLGALPPRVRQLGLDVARLFIALHRADQDSAAIMERATAAGDPFALARHVMQDNESVSPMGSAPRELAAAFVDLIDHVVGPDVEVDAELHGLLRRLCTAVVAVDQASPPELGLDELPGFGPGEFPIGMHIDGSIAVGSVPGYVPIAVGLPTTRQADDTRRGRDFARAAGVEVPDGSTRFRLRSGPLDPARVDVYDEQGERCAIITEEPSKSGEWHVGMMVAGAAKSASSISFARVVDHLDQFLAEVRR